MAKNRLKWLLAGTALLGQTAAGQPGDDPLHFSLLVASDYKLNGLSQTSSDGAWRLAADYAHPTGFFAGGSVANVEFDVEYDYPAPRELETNLYVGYQWRASLWSASVALAGYSYPDSSPDYDYTERTATVSYRSRYYLAYSSSSDYISTRQRTDRWRAGIALPWIGELEASLNVGEFRTRGLFDTSYTFWDVGLSRVFDRIALDLRYHDDTYDRSSLIGETGDDRWVFSITYAVIPRDRVPDSR